MRNNLSPFDLTFYALLNSLPPVTHVRSLAEKKRLYLMVYHRLMRSEMIYRFQYSGKRRAH